MIKTGDRVVAILKEEDGIVYLIGYGVYEGWFVPEPGIRFMGIDMNEAGRENPRIKLDSGEYVYGCECWWGSERAAKECLDGAKEIKTVSIVEERAKHE